METNEKKQVSEESTVRNPFGGNCWPGKCYCTLSHHSPIHGMATPAWAALKVPQLLFPQGLLAFQHFNALIQHLGDEKLRRFWLLVRWLKLKQGQRYSWYQLLPGPPIPLEFLLIKKISTYILRIEKFMSMNGKNRRIRIFSSIVMWPCGVVCAYIMFDLPLNATECQKNAKRTYPERIPKFGNFREMTSILPRRPWTDKIVENKNSSGLRR